MKNIFNPTYIILGKSPQGLVWKTDRYLYRILKIAAMKQIAGFVMYWASVAVRYYNYLTVHLTSLLVCLFAFIIDLSYLAVHEHVDVRPCGGAADL